MRESASFVDYIAALIRSGHQAINVQTVEERRVLDDLLAVTTDHLPTKKDDAPWRLITWDFVNGFSDATTNEERVAGDPTAAIMALPTDRFDVQEALAGFPSPRKGTVTGIHKPEQIYLVEIDNDDKHPLVLPPNTGPSVRVGDQVAMNQILAKPTSKNCLFVFKDMGAILNDQAGLAVRRALRNLLESQRLSNMDLMRPIVFVGATGVKHIDLDASLINVAYSLPTPEELGKVVDYIAAGMPEDAGKVRHTFRKQLSDSMRGFSRAEAENTLAFLAYIAAGFNHGDKQDEVEEKLVREVHKRKREKWASEEAIELKDAALLGTFEDIGGYLNFKQWVKRQKLRFTEEAAKKGVEPPKGCIVGGLPGTGKSLVATIVAKELQLPLVEFKFDALFGSLVGESEARVRSALAKIKALGPCVVRVDEVDKAMAGLHENSGGDSGVGARVLGQFLSWQANENKDAFVIMTLNRMKGLPPELFRTGRFDRVWFVDLPNDTERIDILGIHLRKKGFDINKMSAGEIASLAEALRGATGSDIEYLVSESMTETLYNTNGETAEPTYNVLINLARDLKTVSRTSGDTLETMREMFEGRAYPVSDALATQDKVTKGKTQRSVSLSK